jgi:hypothetical protein
MAKIPALPPMARLPKEPSPDMIRKFGPRPSLETPPGSDAPLIASPSPSAYRETSTYQAPPPPYKAPSLLREHRRLAVLFAGVAVAFGAYCLRWPHGATVASARASSAVAARTSSPMAEPSSAATSPARPPGTPPSTAAQPSPPGGSQPAQPIYIESVPEESAQH